MKTTSAQKKVGNAKAAARAAKVTCAFCEGTGKDPFDLLSKLSQCPVCNGRGTVVVKMPAVLCAYCRGTGRQRHTRLECSGCQGAGVLTLAGPTTRCPQCGGSGREPESDLACSLCKGAGLAARAPTRKQEHRKRRQAWRRV